MAILFTNNASAPIASSITTSSTSITVSSGQGAEFPVLAGSDYFIATLVDTSNNIEIVKVTARSSDTMTVVRAQEGTTARAYAAGSLLELRITAAVLNNLVQASGDQTITGNKTFSSPIIGSVTGNAANVTATTNATLTTLSALSLPGTQVTGTVPNATNATNSTNATNATNSTNATNLVSGGTIASNVTATTQATSDNSTKVATTAYVTSTITANAGGIGSQIATSSGTFTVPTGVKQLLVTVIAGGGAGANTLSPPNGGGGGGGGGVIQGYISGLTSGSTISFTVGGSGGSSSFGSYLTATAGSTGSGVNGGAGGSSSASGATVVYQATGSTGAVGGYVFYCGAAYEAGGGGGASGVYLSMPVYSFNPRGFGGTGAGKDPNTNIFIPATGGTTGLIIIDW